MNTPKSRRFVRIPLLLLLAAGSLSSSDGRAASADDEKCDEKADLAADAATARSFASAFVRVEVAVRYDAGDAPSALASQSDYGTYIQDERPIEAAGIVLSPDRVLIVDPELHPRFVAGITVVAGARRVAATPVAWISDSDGVILKLERPLEGVKPLTFDSTRPPPYRSVYFGPSNDVWKTVIGATHNRLTLDEDGRERTNAWALAIVIDKTGVPVGITLSPEVAADGTGWKGSFESGPQVSIAERDALVQTAGRVAADGLLRVHVRLRSPKGDGSSLPFRFSSRGGGDEEEGNDTERNAVGVLVDARKVVVLAGLDAAATARIEAIDVHTADGTRVKARFVASYRQIGALLVEAETALEKPLVLSTTPIRRHKAEFLLDVRLELQGEKRRTHVTHTRLDDFRQGWRRQWSAGASDSPDGHFVFDRAGALVAFPVARRTNEEHARWRRYDGMILMSSEYLAPMLADPSAHADGANVPVAAEREDRLAWLGVETQRLNRDLARVNGVSEQTQDGRSGALVSYVYAGSPAENAGLRPGHILLRIHAPDHPAPIAIGGSDDSGSSFQDFFDSMGGEMGRFGGFPGMTPWPSVDNALNQTLTKIGAGKVIRLEYAVEGTTREVELTVTDGPPHHDSAPFFKSEPLGVTVRDLTYEVRRHYQLAHDFVGVIVSKVESGGRAAVADLRPMEIVLRVGDQPVADAAAFGKAIAGDGELLLTVKDKLKERVVKIAAAVVEGK